LSAPSESNPAETHELIERVVAAARPDRPAELVVHNETPTAKAVPARDRCFEGSVCSNSVRVLLRARPHAASARLTAVVTIMRSVHAAGEAAAAAGRAR